MLKRVLIALAALLVLCLVVLYGAGRGWLGKHEGPGKITEKPVPADLVEQREQKQKVAARTRGVVSDKQILFGDLHVHTSLSMDAFLTSLPMLQGEGSHPQADACDFARYCSALDFWSINDHAESLTPRNWQETIDSIRQCNAVAGDPDNPDVVAFLGWEWTQVGTTPDNHYGHKNVILADTGPEQVPARPIASRSLTLRAMEGPPLGARAVIALVAQEARLNDFWRHITELQDVDRCADNVDVHDLPLDCRESAATPAELFRKLNEWGHDAIVIPHGTTWGFYTPPGSTWDKQLNSEQHDPDLQTLIEVFSGHGNSEEYRTWRAVETDDGGAATCPAPREDYLPSCWRAGEIIAARCRAAGIEEKQCEARAAAARRNAAAAGQQVHLTVPGAEVEDWLDAGQCKDCFLPSFNYRPGGSAQYILARRDFDDPENPRRFDFGFIASSDVHTARPGTGYKEYDRREMTEATGPASPDAFGSLRPQRPAPEPKSEAFQLDLANTPVLPLGLFEAERQASFFLTGGLVAVHSPGRSRAAIWDALKRREVYGTSGPRILLWFELLNPPGGDALPMGSATQMDRSPVFRVRAAGSFEQQPGCPDYATNALSAERLHDLCRDECYNPSDERRRISRIEVVRIRPQNYPGEPVGQLIEDPWLVFHCAPKEAGCTVTFSDPDHPLAARDTLYYVRAIEEPSPAVNAANLRCEYDAEGNCARVNPCYGDFRTPYEEDCLAENEERAWSSPIFVAFGD